MENIETIESQPEQELTQEQPITVNDLQDGKIAFWKLPREDRDRVSKEIYETLPERAKDAWDMGWRTKELFGHKNKDGTAKEWVDDEEYLQRIHTTAPITNERLHKIASERANIAQERDSYKEQFEALQKQMKALTDISKSKIERDLENEEVSVQRKLVTAKEEGNFDDYEEMLARRNSIEREKIRLKSYEEPPTPPALPELPKQKAVDQEAQEWAARNDWIVKNPTLMKMAIIKDQELELLYPEMNRAERYNEVTNLVREKFPAYDPAPRATYQPAKNSGSIGTLKPKTKTFDDIPKAEKEQALRLIKMGEFKDQAEFLKHYKFA